MKDLALDEITLRRLMLVKIIFSIALGITQNYKIEEKIKGKKAKFSLWEMRY
jgi:hypothetical protein